MKTIFGFFLILKMSKICILSLLAFSLCGSAGASCIEKFNNFFKPTDNQSPLAEKVQTASQKSAVEETNISMDTMTRDAIGGAATGAVMDAIGGEEITPTNIVTDAAIGVGVGTVVRVVAPDIAREFDEVVDDVVDDLFNW